jgi:hypothetical protein
MVGTGCRTRGEHRSGRYKCRYLQRSFGSLFKHRGSRGAAAEGDVRPGTCSPYEAVFLAGKAFVAYRRNGGNKRSGLPGFLIGARAAIAGIDC